MAGRRTARIAFSLVVDLPERLEAAGVTADRAPSVEQAVDLVWPRARQLARMEKAGKSLGKSAARAQDAVLSAAVTACAAPSTSAAYAPRRFADFNPAEWRGALVPGPSADREHQLAS